LFKLPLLKRDEGEKVNSEDEVKIVFQEADEIRVLRGKKIDEDDIFIVLKRDNGTFWINKKSIIKIEAGLNG